MRRRNALVVLAMLSTSGAAVRPVDAQQVRAPARTEPPRPKLVLTIVVDQFRYDYLTRFREHYTSGIDRLLRQGAVFTNAFYEHFPTVTAVGHATILTGATPALSGVVGNEWFDRDEQKQVTSVSDASVKLLGGEGVGSSPSRLLVSTVGDELKMNGRGPSKVIGMSIKDRGAILPAGRMADGAYWFDDRGGNFVSSTYYFDALPAWVAQFNESRAADWFLSSEWKPLNDTKAEPFITMADAAGRRYWGSLERSPFGNEMLEMFAEAAVDGEKLGQRDATDLLTISFSSNDYVGHDYGPDSPRVRDISIRTDRTLGKLFQFLDSRIGMRNILVLFAADHGVAPLPEFLQQHHMPGGRMTEKSVLDSVQARLTSLYGEGKWIAGQSGPAPFLNDNLIAEQKLDPVEVRRQAAEAVRSMPHIFRVYTRDQLAAAGAAGDEVDRRVRNGYNPQRGGDLYIVAEPYWVFTASGTSHGTPFNYDAHVPVIFLGAGIPAGSYGRRIAVNDVAPTLATLLGIETPSGSVGQPIQEIVGRSVAQ